MTEYAWGDTHVWVPDENYASVYLNQSQTDLWHLRQRGDRLLTLGGATNAQAGFVATQDTAADDTVSLVASAGSAVRVVIAMQAITAAAAGHFRAQGFVSVYTADAVTRGDYLQTSGTAGAAIVGTLNPFARAWTSKAAGAGTVIALMLAHANAAPAAFIYAAGAQLLVTNTPDAIAMAVEVDDTDTMHYTAATNISGTVTTAGTTALVGAGTAFLSELSAGQLIRVPGVTGDKRIITAIPTNTSLTVASAFTTSAAGLACERLNTALVIRQPGIYLLSGQGAFAADAVGRRIVSIRVNGAAVNYATQNTVTTGATVMAMSAQYRLAQWSYVELWMEHSSTTSPLSTVAGVNNLWLSALWAHA